MVVNTQFTYICTIIHFYECKLQQQYLDKKIFLNSIGDFPRLHTIPVFIILILILDQMLLFKHPYLNHHHHHHRHYPHFHPHSQNTFSLMCMKILSSPKVIHQGRLK